MELNEMKEIIEEALNRVTAVGLSLGIDLMNLAELLAQQFEEMGVDIVRAAQTGEVQP